MKMSFFAIFASMGLILLIVSIILKNKDKKDDRAMYYDDKRVGHKVYIME